MQRRENWKPFNWNLIIKWLNWNQHAIWLTDCVEPLSLCVCVCSWNTFTFAWKQKEKDTIELVLYERITLTIHVIFVGDPLRFACSILAEMLSVCQNIAKKIYLSRSLVFSLFFSSCASHSPVLFHIHAAIVTHFSLFSPISAGNRIVLINGRRTT